MVELTVLFLVVRYRFLYFFIFGTPPSFTKGVGVLLILPKVRGSQEGLVK